jgi:NADH dehydrogenase [ubiquinone] 1 alpha subcomplex assembly factor 7
VPLAWHRELTEVPEGPAVVIANEFFDALQVHQAVKTQGGWHERMVGIGPDGRLTFALHPDPIPGFAAIVPESVADASTGAVYEWRSGEVAAETARRIAEHGGAALVIDYGHVESALGETFQAVGRHGFADPLAAPGQVDLTAHVDFAALARIARGTGAHVHGPLSQGAFLRRVGIEARATALRAKATTAQATDIDAALARLIGAGREAMGELFKAMAFADRNLGALPGFDS